MSRAILVRRIQKSPPTYRFIAWTTSWQVDGTTPVHTGMGVSIGEDVIVHHIRLEEINSRGNVIGVTTFSQSTADPMFKIQEWASSKYDDVVSTLKRLNMAQLQQFMRGRRNQIISAVNTKESRPRKLP